MQTQTFNVADALRLGIEKFESKDWSNAKKLLEPLANLGNRRAQTYLVQIYWRGGEEIDLRTAAIMQRKLNEAFGGQSNILEIGMFREALILLEIEDEADNNRLNVLFKNMKESRYDKGLVLAASIAKSSRIDNRLSEKPLSIYFRAFKYARSMPQKIRILFLMMFEYIKPSSGNNFKPQKFDN